MTSAAGPRTAVAIATAAACWVVSMGLLLAMPSLAAAEAGPPVLETSRGTSSWWATAVALTAQAVALLWARSAPRRVLLLVTGISLALAVPGPGIVFSLTHLAIMIAVFLAAPRRPGREMLGWLSLTALGVAGGTLLNGLRSGIGELPGLLGEALVQGIGTVAITALVSLALASIRTAREAQRKELDALARERDALGREQEALVRAAAAEERTAMARELHDIAAHHLSGISLMAGAADRQIETDPRAARETVRQVRTQTRTVLDDIRGVVGLLREGESAERSVENLATVPALVESRSVTGAPIRYQERTSPDGSPLGDGIGPLAQLVAHRMIQESLTNAAEHAPGAPCLVTVDDTDPAMLTVSVIDDGAAAGTDVAGPPSADAGDGGSGGFGLVGMRERADLIGAQLDHGPTAAGGWRVHLSIPRDTTGSRPAPEEREAAR